MIYIQTDDAVRTIRRLGITLSPAQLASAESRAINKALGKARTSARSEIKKVYNISQKDLKGVDYQRANAATVTGKLVASRKPIPLDAFAPKQETGSGSMRISKRGVQKTTIFKQAKSNPVAGVSIEIFKNKRTVIPYAFMIPGGAVRVFARGEYKSGTEHGFTERHVRVNSSGNDTPVKPLITISMFGSILNDKVLGNIARDVKIDYPRQLENQIQFILNQV